MKADISADLHDAAKRYTGVRAQQGRVLTDADLNAALDILDARSEEVLRSLVCGAGSPDDGFAVTEAGSAALDTAGGTTATVAVTVAPGRFVLGGRVLHLPGPVDGLDQPDWLSLPLAPGLLPPAPEPGRVDLVTLEMTEQAVRAVEDREIGERALDADTSSRIRPSTRIRVLDDMPPDCADAADQMRARLAGAGGAFGADGTELLSNARLEVGFVDTGEAGDSCAPQSVAGYLGAENHTLRIMLTEPGRFVWALDNGEPLHRVQIDATSGEVLFLTEPRDPVLFPRAGQVIEILPWDAVLPNREKTAAATGHRARLTGEYDPTTRRVAYDGSLPPFWQSWLDGQPAARLGIDDPAPRFFYARIWQAPNGPGTDQAAAAEVVLPGLGLALRFSGAGLAGDYWTASFRTDAPQQVVPWRLGQAGGAAPTGPRRFYAALALLGWADAATARIADCRDTFRPLCRVKGCCTVQVGDGHRSFGEVNSIAAALARLPDEGGEICLLPGRHEAALSLAGRRDVTIRGCGARSVVVPARSVEIDRPPLALLPTLAREPGMGSIDDLTGAPRISPRAVATPSAGVAARPVETTGPTEAILPSQMAGARAVEEDRPAAVLDLTGASRTSLRDFAIESGALLAVAGDAVDGATLRELTVTARSRAVDLSGRALTVERCTVLNPALPAPLIDTDLSTLGPAVALQGRGLTVAGCRIEAASRRGRSRTAPGGLQIGGDSARVTLRDCVIRGGNGNGITLGTTLRVEAVEARPVLIRQPARWLRAGADGCIWVLPPGLRHPETGRPPPRILSEGDIADLEIRGCRIEDHGASGISVGWWFPTGEDVAEEDRDDIEIARAVIADCTIRGCLALNLPAALPADVAFAAGFGGIALSMARDLRIEGTEIRDCAATGRTPFCGIYLRFAARTRLAGNRIHENGRPARIDDPLLIGNVGGIVIGHVEGQSDGFGTELRETPAVFIKDNSVIAQEGRALELTGSGQMLVEGNAFTTHGNNSLTLLALALAQVRTGAFDGSPRLRAEAQSQFRALTAQIAGSAVWILNTGRNPNLGALTAFAGVTAGAKRAPGPTEPTAMTALAAGDEPVAGPEGPVLFSDNAVTYDLLSPAVTLSFAAVAILSLDDVGMHDNQVFIETGGDLVLVNTLVLGLVSARVQGNRFRARLLRAGQPQREARAPLSAMTVGFLNATENNQGTWCFLRLGVKKPRLVGAGSEPPGIHLDTNRHLVPESLCARYDAANRAGS